MDDIELTIEDHDRGQFKRLDHYLTHKIPHLSRTFLKRLFEEGMITAETSGQLEVKLELKKMPLAGTKIEIEIPPPISDEALAQNIPLEILYEDEFLLFINKPAGMVTHPAPGHPDNTLVNALLYHVKDLQGIGGTKRPGIVHRLDRGTSGLMVVAKEQKTHEALVILFSKHELVRRYEALAMGVFAAQNGVMRGNIGRHNIHRQKMAITPGRGRHATTYFKVLKQYHKIAHVQLQLETGRTHQIRVHLSSLLQHSVLNDSTYGNPNEHKQRLGLPIAESIGDYSFPYLHAKYLSLIHPMTQRLLEFEVPLTDPFQKVLSTIQSLA